MVICLIEIQCVITLLCKPFWLFFILKILHNSDLSVPVVPIIVGCYPWLPPLWSSAQEGCCLSGASLTEMWQPTRGFHRLSCYLCFLWPGTFPQELISYLTWTFHNIKAKKQSKLKSCFLTLLIVASESCEVENGIITLS